MYRKADIHPTKVKKMSKNKPLTTASLLREPAANYMNEAQQGFFRALLEEQKRDLQLRIDGEFQTLKEFQPESDPVDVGSSEEQRQWQLRMLEREKKLLDKLDQALERLARGEYGWCEETGEAIGLQRLLLRPTATLCIEAKERQEHQEKHQRDR